MKRLISLGIITGVCFAGELLHFLLPLPVPASIYGLLLMLLLLLTGVVKLQQVEKISHFFLTIMPLLFIEPAVKLMTSAQTLQGHILAILTLCFASTIIVIVITGLCAELLCNAGQQKNKRVSEDNPHDKK